MPYNLIECTLAFNCEPLFVWIEPRANKKGRGDFFYA